MQCPQCDKQCATPEGVLRHRQVVHHNIQPRGGTVERPKKRSAPIVLRPLLEEVS